MFKTKGVVDIVLINCPVYDGDEVSYYPLNILYLASYLESKGHSVEVLDPAAEGLSLSKTFYKVAYELKPKIVGLSAMTPGIQSAVNLGKTFKEAGFITALGGVHLTCDPEFLSRYPYFDFGITGEAETKLEELVSKIKGGEAVQGLFQGQSVVALDTLPFPARHLINKSIYKRKEQLKSEIPAAGMLSSRGCPYGCLFCSIPARASKVRFRSVKNIVDEMEEIYDSCGGSYSFVDDCFSINRQRTFEFCQEIIDRKLNCKWIASTRADKLDYELAYILKRAGCVELYFGVESMNDKIRNKVIGKQLKEEAIIRAVTLCRKVKIMSNLFLILGFPEEGKKEIMDTVNVGKKIKADAIGIHLAIPFPGSQLYNYSILNNKIPKDTIDRFVKSNKKFREEYPNFIPDGFTREDMVNFKKMGYRRFYLNLSWLFRRINIWLSIKGRFVEDLKLLKLIKQIFLQGGSRGQLS